MFEEMVQISFTIANNVVVIGGEIDGQVCVSDLRKQHGPVGGIEALLHSEIDSRYLVLGCDMPTLTKKDVMPLLESEDNAVFSYNNRILGLPLAISGDERFSCTAYLDSGGKSIWGFVTEIQHTVCPLDESTSKLFRSINSPDDLDMFTLE
jgi:molybdopterin-guanine dinucleotide biosynthesis protein A